ncbi:cell division protein PerM [Nocardiopsis coralliicola]
MGAVTPPSARPSADHRPLYTAGGLAAAWAAGLGLAVILTIAVIGWIAAPHDAFGEEIGDVARTAVQGWLVGHQVGFGIPGGEVMMLPLGLAVLPGLLLYRAGRRLARAGDLPRLRSMFRAALALAGPYAAISGTLALIAQTDVVRPSVLQALVAGFALAFLAGGLGVLRQQLIDKGIPFRRLLQLMPDRPRSLLAGTAGATAVLLAAGTVLVAAGLAAGFSDAMALTRTLGPGPVGGGLLLLLQFVYLPNAVVFGLSYAVGPGFSVGAGTMVAPTGVAVGPVPLVPLLSALPDNGPAPAASLAALAAPFIAGIVGGILTQRSAPAAVSEAAPLWGFVCGVATGLVCAALSVLAGGPIGAERMATVGPSAWQVGLITALEVGVAAAIAAWIANWRHLRATAPRPARPGSGAERAPEPGTHAPRDEPEPAPDTEPKRPKRPKRSLRPVRSAAQDAEPWVPDAAGEPEPPGAEAVPGPDRPGPRVRTGSAPKTPRRRRLPSLRRAERPAPAAPGELDGDEELEELFGISYEAGPESGPRR